jgi:hypothetical protein
MKRIGLLLIPFLFFLVACGASETVMLDQGGDEVPGSPSTPASSVETSDEPAATTAPDAAATTSNPATDDPVSVRERDWKLGDTVDPAVTVIEYGDFQ